MMEKSENGRLVVILGHTAAGKTSLAAQLARAIDGEIISADSRQVYRDMNLGTGKDYDDYRIDGVEVPYHLVDIREPGEKYNVFDFQNDFLKAWNLIHDKGKQAILCGGTGMYIDAVIQGYRLVAVPVDEELRASLDPLSTEELVERLKSLKALHNTTDITHRKRLIRAIEIAEHNQESPDPDEPYPVFESVVTGVRYDRMTRRDRITRRLKERLDSGLVEEVEALIQKGVPVDTLVYYGLEYKYLALHITGKLSREEMIQGLNTAIHQFAKRQMTWFRHMESKGVYIHWVEGSWPLEKKLEMLVEWTREPVQVYRPLGQDRMST